MLAQIPHHIPGGLRIYGMTVCGRRLDFVRARHVDYGDPRGRLDVDFNIDGRYITFTARIADACKTVAALRDAIESHLAGAGGEATVCGVTATVRGLIIEVAADRMIQNSWAGDQGANGFRLCCPDRRTLTWLGKALGKLTGQIPSRPGCIEEAMRQEEIYRNTVRSLANKAETIYTGTVRTRRSLKPAEDRDILRACLLAEEIMREDRGTLH